MPFTPFHLGPGALLHALAPQSISFMSFSVVTVLIDVEPLIYILRQDPPLHRYMHTLPGAFVAALAGTTLVMLLQRLHGLPDMGGWQKAKPVAVASGALLGGGTHLLLDGLMHADMHPFAPFTGANPLLGAVSLSALHLGCLLAGLVGAGLLAWRRWRPGARS